MTKFFKKSKKYILGSIWTLLLKFDQNCFLQKRGLCQFLNIPIIFSATQKFLTRKTNMQILRRPYTKKQFTQLRSATSKNVFLILTTTGLISMTFYRARESSVQDQQLQRARQKFFWKSVERWLPWLIKQIWDFRLVKMVKFDFFSIYFTHLKLPKLIFHSHNSCNFKDYFSFT